MTKENKRMVVMGGSFNPPTRGVGTSNSSLFAKQMNGLGNTLLILGNTLLILASYSAFGTGRICTKKLWASTCLPDTCPLYS